MLPLPHLLVVLAAITGTALLLGGVGWLWYRIERLEERSGDGGGSRRRLASEMEDVRDELAETRQQTRQHAERLDFLERLLEADGEPADEGRQLNRGPSPDAG